MALADTLNRLRDSDVLERLRGGVLRPRNVLPALVAFAFGAIAWVGIGPSLIGEDEPPPPVVEAALPEPEPEPEALPEPEPPPFYAAVLVARLPLAAGALIERRHVAWQDWPELPDEQFILQETTRTLREAATAFVAYDPIDGLIGAFASRSYGVGEPLQRETLIGPNDAGYLPGVLKPGFRAVAVEADRPTNTAGLVRVGDRVDVMLVATNVPGAPGGDAGPVADAVVRDVRVVGVGQSFFLRPNDPVPDSDTLTLEVRPRDAARLSLARATGALSLLLRSSSDPAPTQVAAAVRMDDVVATTPEPPTTTLRILRGTQAEMIVLGADGVAAPDDRSEES